MVPSGIEEWLKDDKWLVLDDVPDIPRPIVSLRFEAFAFGPRLTGIQQQRFVVSVSISRIDHVRGPKSGLSELDGGEVKRDTSYRFFFRQRFETAESSMPVKLGELRVPQA